MRNAGPKPVRERPRNAHELAAAAETAFFGLHEATDEAELAAWVRMVTYDVLAAEAETALPVIGTPFQSYCEARFSSMDRGYFALATARMLANLALFEGKQTCEWAPERPSWAGGAMVLCQALAPPWSLGHRPGRGGALRSRRCRLRALRDGDGRTLHPLASTRLTTPSGDLR